MREQCDEGAGGDVLAVRAAADWTLHVGRPDDDELDLNTSHRCRAKAGNSQPVQQERHWLGLLSQPRQRDNEDEEWTRLCVTWVAFNRSAYAVYVCMCDRALARA